MGKQKLKVGWLPDVFRWTIIYGQCDSPTSSKESMCLIFNIASFCWPCQSGKIESAFYKITILTEVYM